MFTTGVDALDAIFWQRSRPPAPLSKPRCRSTGGRVRQLAEHQRRGQRGPAELRHRNHGSTLINNTANAGNFNGGRRVHGHADGLVGVQFAATGALTGATLTTGPLDCKNLDCTFTAECRRAAWSAAT